MSDIIATMMSMSDNTATVMCMFRNGTKTMLTSYNTWTCCAKVPRCQDGALCSLFPGSGVV